MTYSWPLEPFDQPHPVRANFNDPRISGESRAFHFGIDISAPNGTAVYAVEPGIVHLEDARAISVAAGDTEFGYWHVVPAVQARQQVAKHDLLGHIDAPWLHVHFAERRSGSYRNPLRAGALAPWNDTHSSGHHPGDLLSQRRRAAGRCGSRRRRRDRRSARHSADSGSRAVERPPGDSCGPSLASASRNRDRSCLANACRFPRDAHAAIRV